MIGALFLMLVLLPAVVGLCRGVGMRLRLVVVTTWLATTILVAWGARLYEQSQFEQPGRIARPVEHREDGYLSSRTCKACHPHEHATWDASYHPRMTDLVTPQTVVGKFDGEEVIVAGESYLLERIGDEYWAEFANPDPDTGPAGEAAGRIRKRLVMSTGSHHMQVYWYETGEGRTLGQLPIVYLNEAQRWIPREASFLNPPGEFRGTESGAWKMNCITCHTTGHKPGLKSRTPSSDDATRVAEFGIGCEACHGPAEDHARHYRDPLQRYGRHFDADAKTLIVQPEHLTHQRSSQVCGQCHGVHLEYSQASFRKWMMDGNSYRPGDALEETQLLVCNANRSRPEVSNFLAQNPRFWSTRFWADGMTRVSGREYNGLVETPCFQRGEMSCLSCHAMHQPADDQRQIKEWANDQLKPQFEGNRACTQCHEGFVEPQALAAHTHHAADSTGSQCYNCHMPHTSYGLLKAIRSHEVDSPDVKVELSTGRPNACNLCHLDKTLGWTAKALHDWYQIPEPAGLSADQREVAYSILRLTSGDAGQRALVAWSMGWPPAQQASGNTWMAPYLALALDDSYVAVRYIGARSLKRLPGLAGFSYDFLGPSEERAAAPNSVIALWARELQGGVPKRELHIDSPTLRRLLSERDNRPIYLNE